MSNENQTHKVETGKLFSDDRGSIHPLNTNFGNVQIIKSNAGAVRANHYHLTDSHLCHVLSGKIRYFWRNRGEQNIVQETISEGESFLTGPNIEHEMVFLENSVMVVVSEFQRDTESYEKDIVRIPSLSETRA